MEGAHPNDLDDLIAALREDDAVRGRRVVGGIVPAVPVLWSLESLAVVVAVSTVLLSSLPCPLSCADAELPPALP